ncbi:mechanosensitive ion channel family protein [Acidomonas methanolica]|uniref:mechanosensitive ion channel family protein n=1 Tax=Acidomonas methanolica TaxID=437 RepID=UPI002119C9EE|nr:mechanosensitive ion channel domain-containing protein [Acidomonas methanolica]MCQ9155153.1 mechanosensitive ion channel [Acidomonas methanolica]
MPTALVPPAFAQGSANAQAGVGKVAPQLSDAQAQQLLGVLNDDTKRKQFVETLQNLVQAQSGAASTSSATSSAAAVAKPLEPNSLGVQLLGGATTIGTVVARRSSEIARTILDFREVRGWSRQITTDDAKRAEVLKILLRAVIFIAVATGLYLLAALCIRRPKSGLSRAAQRRWEAERATVARDQREAEDAAQRDARERTTQAVIAQGSAEGMASNAHDAAIEVDKVRADVADEKAARIRHQGALSRLLVSIRRTPFAAGCLLLDLIPIAMIFLTATGLVAVDPAGDRGTEEIVRALATCGVITTGLLALAGIMLAPKQPWMRLINLTNWVAQFLYRWLCRIVVVSGVGTAVIVLLKECFLPEHVIVALLKILALTVHLLIAAMIIYARAPVAAFCVRVAKGEYATHALALFARIWWVVALFFDLGLWLVWAAGIRDGYEEIWTFFLRSVIALVIVRLTAIAAYGLLERGFRKAPELGIVSEEISARFGLYYPILRRIVGVVIFLVGVFVFALAWGAPIDQIFGQDRLGRRLFVSLLTVLVTLVIATVVWEIVNIAIERQVKRVSDQEDGVVKVARIRTLQPMMRILLLFVLASVLILTILSEIGVNVAPLLAGASIFGVALGFGSQKLVQDFINGIFLLMENALTVGDAVTLNGVSGVVERLSVRTVHVRGADGSMNIFPFSSLSLITNFNRDYAKALIAAEVSYDTNTDDVARALADITAEMREDEAFRDVILGDFELWGVDSFNDSSITVKGAIKTLTSARWPVFREFNRRMKKCFDARGIDMPFPTRTVQIDGLDEFIDARQAHPETPKPDDSSHVAALPSPPS